LAKSSERTLPPRQPTSYLCNPHRPPGTAVSLNRRTATRNLARSLGCIRQNQAIAKAGNTTFDLNLHLPDQLYKPELDQNYNLCRDCGPVTCRYTRPDLIGLASGANPDSFLNGNPMSCIDPGGLYDVDIHFYVTYFLAIEAVIDSAIAL